MKTTKVLGILAVLLVSFVGLLSISCSKQDLSDSPVDFNGSETRAPHFFTGILKPKELRIHPSNGNGYRLGKTDYTSLLLLLSGDAYVQHQYDTFEEFKKLATKIGDTESKEGYLHATPVSHQTMEVAISGVMVKALSQYDDAHPQGSSLKDIIRINYESFDHVFDKTLKPTAFGSANHARYSVEPADEMPQIKYPALISGTFVGAKGYKDGLLMSIEFLQAPSVSKQQIQITLRFEDGSELKKDITVDILKVDQ